MSSGEEFGTPLDLLNIYMRPAVEAAADKIDADLRSKFVETLAWTQSAESEV